MSCGRRAQRVSEKKEGRKGERNRGRGKKGWQYFKDGLSAETLPTRQKKFDKREILFTEIDISKIRFFESMEL